MKKRMLIMLICLGILFGAIFGFKAFISGMIKKSIASQVEIAPVTTIKAEYSQWQPHLNASGSLRALRGVNVSTELAGIVETIYFQPGSFTKQGDVLVQLRATSDRALLNSLQANEELALSTYKRDKAQYAIHAISKAVLDTDAANLKSLTAQVAQQAAIVAKKTIRAPFDGRLGISAINPGQYVNAGDMIVTLQTLNPIYVDFYVPQQTLAQLKVAQAVVVTADAFPGKNYTGKITTINPIVDANTRNVEVEATIDNPKEELIPGMYATVNIDTGVPQRFLTLPQTAISFNPYGEIIYLVSETGKDKDGKPILTAKQVFVTTGDTRGDQVAVLKGLQEGDIVVTSGQLKLKNGSQVMINNSIMPSNSPNPITPNEH